MTDAARKIKKTGAADDPVQVGTTQELITQIQAANALTSSSQVLSIAIENTLTLSAQLPAINTAGTFNIGAASDAATVDGASTFNGFVILSGTVSLSNLTLQNMKAQGASGCLGAGGGLFVANVTTAKTTANTNPYLPKGGAPSVTLSSVTFSNCQAIGGTYVAGGSGGAGGTGGVGGDTNGNNGGPGTGTVLSGDGPLGIAITAGYFGVGADGASVNGGQGGQYYNQGAVSGSPGGSANPGGQGGFGAGAGAGSGGGGGGGGTGASFSAGGTGGDGANGGAGGTAGFGGGAPGTWTAGSKGSPGTGGYGEAEPEKRDADRSGWPPWPPHQPGVGGTGGQGGNGAAGGGGAGLGGSIFVMGGASLLIEGTATISGGTATGGTSPNAGGDGAGVGSGIFLQGTGTLTFSPLANETITISDPIVDEAGAVAAQLIDTNNAGNGPDNLPAGGGSGTWAVAMNGDGVLVLQGSHAFTGGVSVSSGALNLSNYTGGIGALSIGSGAALIQQPASATALQLTSLTLHASAALSLNAYASINATTLTAKDFIIALDPSGFSPGVPVKLVTWTNAMTILPTVTLQPSSGYQVSVQANYIAVTKNPSSTLGGRP